MFPKPLVAASLKPIMLSLLSSGDMYGYQIIQRVYDLSQGQIRWTASKLYPILHKLENEGLVQAYWRASESGPDRKYYALTPKGEKALVTARQEWRAMNAMLNQLWQTDLAAG